MQVGWIDFSPEERSRTLTVLNSLSEQGSVDELGIGIVRDGMADLLFPATSTLLTKARYFFLVPYLSRLLEEEHDNERQDPRALRARFDGLERKCAEGMLACEKTSEGIIGRIALSSGKWVTRGPGEIYWASIRSLGFMGRNAPDSFFAQFPYLADTRLRTRKTQYERRNSSEDNGLSDDSRAIGSMWKLPRGCYDEWRKSWESWREHASIQLTEEEARYLRKQIITLHPETLYSLILTDDSLRSLAMAVLYGGGENLELGDSSFHTFLRNGGLARIEQLSPKIAQTCVLAENFSELVLGCRIAYNMQLAGLEEDAAKEWESFQTRASDVAERVDLDGVCSVLGLYEHGGFKSLKAFLSRAQECMTSDDLESLKHVIAVREAAIKGTRKKIGRKDMGSIAWRGGRRLPYRFANAMSIIREIQEAGGCDA